MKQRKHVYDFLRMFLNIRACSTSLAGIFYYYNADQYSIIILESRLTLAIFE